MTQSKVADPRQRLSSVTPRTDVEGVGAMGETATATQLPLKHEQSRLLFVPLGDIAEVKLGKMLDRSKHKSGRSLPYLRNINVRWGSVDTSDLLEMYFKNDREEVKFSLRKGDVLVCEGGEPGRAAVWTVEDSDLKYQKALHRVRFNEPYEPKLLVYFLEWAAGRGELENRFTGSTIKHFTRQAFVQLPVPNPPLPEQRRIVARIEALFSRLDAGTAALRQAKAQLQRYRQSVLAAAVTGQLTQADTSPWSKQSLAEVGRLYCGQSPKTADVNHDEVGTPYVTGPEQWDGNKVLRSKWTSTPKCLVPDGCIFITVKGAGVGKLFPGIACAIGRDVYAFEPNDTVDKMFLEHYLRFTIDEIVRHARGDIPGLSKGQILNHDIKVPPIAEQHQIVAEVESRTTAIDHLEAELERQINRSNCLRKSALSEAFCGKI